MALQHSPSAAVSGLLFCVDPANPRSYGGTGVTLSDLIGLTTGTLTNGPIFNANSAGYFSYDGTDDFVSFGNISTLGLTGSATIEAWVRVPSSWTTGSLYPSIIGKGPSNGWDTDGWSLFAFRPNSPGTENWIGVGHRNGATSTIRYFANALLDQWMQIIASWNGTTVTIYQNTIERVNNSQAIAPAGTTSSVRIARDNATAYLKADIGAIRIYNRVLDASERLQNYQSLRGRYGI